MIAKLTSDPVLITIVVCGFFILLALIAILRYLVARRDTDPPNWRRLRVGVFMERDRGERPSEPPTTLDE